MAVKYVLIFILKSTNPAERYTTQAWDKLFPSYDGCLKQASTIKMENAVLKDCKTVEVRVPIHRRKRLCSHRNQA